MQETKLNYLSHDGRTQIYALLWEPEADVDAGTDAGAGVGAEVETEDSTGVVTGAGTDDSAAAKKDAAELPSPKGIIQIAHGMAEHIHRYRDFAGFLVQNGFIVTANDHIGHGKSVSSPDDWGNIPLANGKEIFIEDVHQLRNLVSAHYPATPYFLFGHSMGSFIVRAYCARYATGLAGVIVCGTGQLAPLLSKAGNLLAHLMARFKGEAHKSKLLEDMGVGAYAKAIANPRTKLDWLSVDQQNVDDYIADPACGFRFSTGGDAALTSLTSEIVKPACAQAIPLDLPMFFIAGDKDPVGDNGKGVLAAVEQLRQSGHNHVELNLYPGMRHEILNETGHQVVYQDVLRWLNGLTHA
ncbi:alpha/beta hydrolase [Actinomycetota bacterium]|nr:alpha/beta hydrolase [Actinomycetota bacterium]